jgi:PHD/YefM family antitoxin component YafN of YafNO toxin-antitoxin module
MSAAAIRTNLHQLIDTVENTDLLQHFYEVLYLLQQQPARKEVTEELTSAQKNRLEQSLAQSASGQTISNDDMKEKIKQWLSK